LNVVTEISSLTLTAFRNYEQARLDGLSAGFIFLTGPNGAGKTNILEAISLLTPGRGLRNADLPTIQSRDYTSTPWAVSAQVRGDYGSVTLGTGRDPQKQKRAVRIQGVPAKSQADLAEYVSCLWLTPQMDRLFLDGASVRRKFLDRLVFTYDPSHAGRTTRYERAMQERLKLLKEKRFDGVWLDALEMQMAESGVAIAAARWDMVERLQRAQNQNITHDFPRAEIHAQGFLENALRDKNAAQVEDDFRALLKSSRDQDSADGITHHGVHRSDLYVVFQSSGIPAHACSTGEQKALLIGLILSHAILIKAELGRVPILLMDEIMAHLDEGRRGNLLHVLGDLRGQVFITATEASLFHDVTNGQFWRVENGHILRDFYPENTHQIATKNW
jgi:DNA replication and repair protein RecF